MSLLTRKGFLGATNLTVQAKRFRQVNVQKPRKPFFERALLFETSKPIFHRPPEIEERNEMCFTEWEKRRKLKASKVENPLQRIFAEELLDRFRRSKLIAFFHKNSIPGETEFHALAAFHKEGMEYKVYGKDTLEMAINGTHYEPVKTLFQVSTACVFSSETNVKGIFKVTKKFPQLVLLAGVFENKFVSKDELVYFSNIPNIQTAQAELVQTLSGAANQLVSHLGANQQILLSQLSERSKQLEDTKE